MYCPNCGNELHPLTGAEEPDTDETSCDECRAHVLVKRIVDGSHIILKLSVLISADRERKIEAYMNAVGV